MKGFEFLGDIVKIKQVVLKFNIKYLIKYLEKVTNNKISASNNNLNCFFIDFQNKICRKIAYKSVNSEENDFSDNNKRNNKLSGNNNSKNTSQTSRTA